MSLNIEELLQPISPDATCGEDLEYDAGYAELERFATAIPERELGGHKEPMQPPNWKEVRRRAPELLKRTRDLRIEIHLARALLNMEGFIGFNEGLALLRETVARYWEDMYPKLDPDEDNDPTQRVNILAGLCDFDTVLWPMQTVPLVESRTFGRFSFKDYQLATGKLEAKADETPPQLTTIQAAFIDADIEAINGLYAAVKDSIEHLNALENSVTDQVGADQALSLSPPRNQLKEIRGILEECLVKKGVGIAATEAQEETLVPGGGTAVASGSQVTGINNRQDVVRTLDLICDYYARNEPSSPLPLLLQRARRLVPMNFMEIMQDLAPDGLAQIEIIKGPEPQ